MPGAGTAFDRRRPGVGRFATIGAGGGSRCALAALRGRPGAGRPPPEHSPYRDIRKGHTFTADLRAVRRRRRPIRHRPARRPGLRLPLRHPHRLHVQFGLGLLRGAPAADRGSVRRAGQPGVGPGGPDRHLGGDQPPVQPDRRQDAGTGSRPSRRGRRLTFPSSTPADTSGFEFGHKIYLAPYGRRAPVRHRPAARSAARPGPSSGSSSIPDFDAGTAARAGDARPTQRRHHRRRPERVGPQLLAPGRARLLLRL